MGSPSCVHKMLALCDEFAIQYSVVFNANKSKYLVVQLRQTRQPSLSNLPQLDFHVGGNVIEIVLEWPHLGHIIFNQCLDDAGIFHRHNCVVWQINLAHSTNLPTGLYILLNMSKAISGSTGPIFTIFHQMGGICVNFLDLDEFFRFPKEHAMASNFVS